MAWTRSLGTESEALRPDTWPIVEYLKRYPPPSGETSNYTDISASDVQSYSETLLNTSTAPNAMNHRPDTSIGLIVSNIRTAGRSIEYVVSLHAAYQQLLTNYDKKVQAVASNSGQAALSSSRITFAT